MKIKLETNLGNIILELNHEKAPVTADNFVNYVESGFYNGTIFHRVIDGFMIQGGGFNKDMEQKETNDPIANEADNGLKNKIGSIAMARTQDPHSATAQFFINVASNSFLDFKNKQDHNYGYCVFGEVIEGMDIVEKIKGVKTSNNGMHQDVPVEPIVIEKAEKIIENNS